jgi:hypothetical protein
MSNLSFVLVSLLSFVLFIMNSLLILFFAPFLFFQPQSTSSKKVLSCPYHINDEANVIKGEFIVQFRDNFTGDSLLLRRRGHETIHQYDSALNGRSIRSNNIEDLLEDENVVDVSCNFLVRADCKAVRDIFSAVWQYMVCS